MLHFDFDAFAALLRSVPEPVPLYDNPEHSEYLQREVFDKLQDGEEVDLSLLDLGAFDLGHVTPEAAPSHFQQMLISWEEYLNKSLKLLPAVSRVERSFF